MYPSTITNHAKTLLPLSLILLIAKSGLLVLSQSDKCKYDIVESMPDKLTFNKSINFHPTPTHDALIEIANNAKSSLKIASFYVTLSAEQEFVSHPSAQPGKNLMDAIVGAAKRGVTLEVILDKSNKKDMSNSEDVKTLQSVGTVRFLNMRKLLNAGVMHTKFIVADSETFYIGSSNFDWRSYTQIKEIGIRFTQCNTLAEDLEKIFQIYKYISDEGQVPESFPDDMKTTINSESPFKLKLDDLNSNVYLTSSPPAFNGGEEQWTGRTDDIDGVLSIINKARKRIDISVMNYSPRTEFVFPKKFWPRIDNALRKAAAERNVQVRLLFSDWSHAKEEEIMWYKSLNAIQSKAMKGSIHVRMFKVPVMDDFQKKVPFARVKHDKYMVTEDGLYIGTSNWAPDYFINTCGVGVVIEPASESANINGTIIQDMQALFERDFSSEHSREL